MSEEQRIYAYYNIDITMVRRMFHSFDKSIAVDIITPIHSGMSTSNYCITDGQRKYLLKYTPVISGSKPSYTNIFKIKFTYLSFIITMIAEKIVHIPMQSLST